MKMPPKKCIAIKAFAAVLLAAACSVTWAGQVAGTVIHLSGALMAQKADGKAKVLSMRSEVEQGDTLVSEKNTYAQIKFIDNSEITIKPDTTFKIEAFAFDAGKPEGDSASFNLVKGGLRSITGLLGKRNKEKFQLKTPTATIGIRGTTFVAQFIPVAEEDTAQGLALRTGLSAVMLATQVALPPVMLAQAPPPPPTGGAGLAPGLYVHVIDGLINLTNNSGVQSFAAGQFGFTPSFRSPPVILPNNPGLQFTPPPAFSAPATKTTSAGNKAAGVDCEVR
ncbi:MAG: FecR family protein [Pseudomonadota bacterium]